MPTLLPPCCPRRLGKRRQEMSRDLRVGVRHQTLPGWGNASAPKQEFLHHPTDRNATQDFPAGISQPVFCSRRSSQRWDSLCPRFPGMEIEPQSRGT